MRIALWTLWILAVGLGLAAMAVFAQGLIRDRHVGDPELALSLNRATSWTGDSFRVWGEKPYRLHLSSVNHEPPFGTPYRGSFEVRLVSPSGERVFERRYDGGAIGHLRPDNNHWSDLASFDLSGRPWRSWRLEARVVEPDQAFEGVHTNLILRRVRYDPGMGGMINYVMPIPGFFFLLLSLLPAAALSRRGALAPFRISAGVLVVLVLVLGSNLIG